MACCNAALKEQKKRDELINAEMMATKTAMDAEVKLLLLGEPLSNRCSWLFDSRRRSFVFRRSLIACITVRSALSRVSPCQLLFSPTTRAPSSSVVCAVRFRARCLLMANSPFLCQLQQTVFSLMSCF
jgi:hypothetical protein